MPKIIIHTEKATDIQALIALCPFGAIEYNGKENTVTLRGNAEVNWKDDVYKAAMIVVDLDTNDISLYGTISGAFND